MSLLLTLNIFTPFSTASIVDFEHVNQGSRGSRIESRSFIDKLLARIKCQTSICGKHLNDANDAQLKNDGDVNKNNTKGDTLAFLYLTFNIFLPPQNQ